MEYTIRNEHLRVTVQSHGGSLRSILDPEGTQYLWQGDPAYWKGQAPNLFPYIGRMTGGRYTLDGREYRMDIHGFVKDSELEAGSRDETSICLRLRDNDVTRGQYPYRFCYEVAYRLEGRTLSITYRVTNEGGSPMYFGIGGHPGFCVPLEDGLRFEDYELRFGGNEAERAGTRRVVLSEARFVTGKTAPFSLGEDGVLPLRHELFDQDAIVLTEMPREVWLRSAKGRKTVRVVYPQMRYLGLWHAPRTDAPYLCIEPWSSLPSRDGIVEDLSAQPGLIALKAGERYENRWEISV